MTVILCDIDGTLSDTTHRRHFIEGDEKDWDAFFDAADKDPAIEPVCGMVRELIAGGATVIFVTGRPVRTRGATEVWLMKNDLAGTLIMRADGDRRPDTDVKRDTLQALRASGINPDIAIEDRKRVVEMYRAEGLICLQCAEGNY